MNYINTSEISLTDPETRFTINGLQRMNAELLKELN